LIVLRNLQRGKECSRFVRPIGPASGTESGFPERKLGAPFGISFPFSTISPKTTDLIEFVGIKLSLMHVAYLRNCATSQHDTM